MALSTNRPRGMGILRCIAAFVSAWLLLGCLVSPTGRGVGSLGSILAGCLVLAGLCRLAVRLPDVSRPFRCSWLILLAGLLSGLWMICLQAVPAFQARSVQLAASDLYLGHHYLFEPGEYMALNPQSSGLFGLHLLLQNVNPDTTLPFQVLNILCYMGILFSLGQLAMELEMGPSGRLSAVLVGMAFLPLLLAVTNMTGMLPALLCMLVGMRSSIRFFRGGQWYFALTGALLLALAAAVHPVSGVWMICLMLFALGQGLLRGKKRCFLLAALLALGWILSVILPILMAQHLTGCALRGGISPLAHLAAGLRTDGPNGPGWVQDYAERTYFEAGMSFRAQSAQAANCISGILQGYLMDPKSALAFFLQKNASQWSDPLFGTVQTNLAAHNASGAQIAPWLDALLHNPAALGWAMKLPQLFVYGGLALWAWLPSREKTRPEETLLVFLFLGGFVFHTFWEANGLDTLVYFVLLIPPALAGYRRLRAPVLSR